ncbi:Iterative polyketide synthase CazM 4 [Colletotrichum chlorophyti]|uniref:Iterative polyketide synthase CazM 4 n=1 Tax=Colletotrichum chlorophyti TaxID=708187 RepID=A0A1Q8S0C3_9PEZI|nr:Iterative polyketide synthase CazM 4 [Colletotrichum chlorophyti]
MPADSFRKQKLHILELGAGTGGTTKWLAPLLETRIPEGRVEYMFTDIAGALVSQAEKSFGSSYEFMTFSTHNIESPPSAELCGNQDIVIVVNAVHATANIVHSLSNNRQLLRPKTGIVLMLEILESSCWADFIFGFFDCWWRFDDGRRHALASGGKWKQAFLEAGFASVYRTEGTCRDSGFQSQFLGTLS